ncbi:MULTISPECIES: hypothetical protein [unclassified Wolbachia]|nr:hypothetical protein [Wolbachia endosymbiont (group A) of Apoderus coryli]
MFVANMNKHLRVTSASRVSSQCLTLESSFFIIIKTLYFNIKRLLLCLPT